MNVSRRELLLAAAGSAALCAPGCKRTTPAPDPSIATPAADARPLRVLVVEPRDGYSEKLERIWQSQSDAPFDLRTATAAEAIASHRFKSDVLIYPSRFLGTFAAADRIVPLPRSLTDGERLQANDLLRHVRTTEVTWGAATMAVCLGMPTFMLLYRRDLFEKRSLQPPTTWTEYQALAAELAEPPSDADDAAIPADAWSPALEPLADGAEYVLLARAAAYARNRSDFGALFDLKTMDAQIATPPFIRALEELVATHALAGKNARTVTRQQSLQRLLEGACAMTWGFPTAAGDSPPAPQGANIGIAPLPGSTDVYDFRAKKWLTREAGDDPQVPLLGIAGVLASVTTEARQIRAAENFLAWLSAGESAVEVAASSSDAAPFRRSHLARLRPWLPAWVSSQVSEQYGDTIRATHEQAVVLSVPRLPGVEDYLAALRKAVAQALAGEKKPTDALTAAAQACDAITDRLGRETQRTAYQRSLGLDI